MRKGNIFFIISIFLFSGFGVSLVFAEVNAPFEYMADRVEYIGDFVGEKMEDLFKRENRLPMFENEEVKYLFFGDLMFDRDVATKIERKGVDYYFEKLSKSDLILFEGNDFVIANLEGAVTDNAKYYEPVKFFDFAFATSSLSALINNYGFNAFGLSNNHFSDQGERGEKETRKNLDDLGVNYFGCTDGKIGKCSYEFVRANGRKVGFFSFGMTFGGLDLKRASDLIFKMRGGLDDVVVSIHWGVEYEHLHNSIQEEAAKSLIDAGASMVIGHHPHVVQGMQIYKGKPIFYSLGNFIFDQYFSPDTQEGLALKVNSSLDSLKIELVPFRMRSGQIIFMNGKERGEFLERFFSWSESGDELRNKFEGMSLVINRK